jgi:hypothetical protein
VKICLSAKSKSLLNGFDIALRFCSSESMLASNGISTSILETKNAASRSSVLMCMWNGSWRCRSAFSCSGVENLEPLLVNALSEQFFDALSGEDFLEGCLCLFDQSAPKRAQAKLNDGAIVQDLSDNIGGVDRLLEVRHEQHVTRGVEVVVESIMIYVTEDRPGTE